MKHAYASFNKALTASWEGIAPDVPVVYDRPVPPATLPAECLRINWLSLGRQTTQPGEEEALIQLDLFTPGNNRRQALSYAGALDDALGFTSQGGYGRIGRFDFTATPAAYLSEMSVQPAGDGWLGIPDEQPGIVHLVRRLTLTYTT